MNFAIFACFFVSFQVIGSHGMTIELTAGGNRRTFSIPSLARASESSSTTLPMARQTQSTTLNIPSVSTTGATDTNVAAVFPSTQITTGTAGLETLRRATELVADRIVSALGGIVTLIDIIRNTSTNGDVAWSNLGSSSQVLTNRFLRLGMNTANTLLQELNNQLSVSDNPSAVLQSFINIPNIERFAVPQGTIGSILRSTPLANVGQTFFSDRVSSTVSQNGAEVIPAVVDSTTGNLTANLNRTGNGLPSVTTISTTRPGLNLPTSSITETAATTVSNNQPESITSEVETFLENLANSANTGVTS